MVIDIPYLHHTRKSLRCDSPVDTAAVVMCFLCLSTAVSLFFLTNCVNICCRSCQRRGEERFKEGITARHLKTGTPTTTVFSQQELDTFGNTQMVEIEEQQRAEGKQMMVSYEFWIRVLKGTQRGA